MQRDAPAVNIVDLHVREGDGRRGGRVGRRLHEVGDLEKLRRVDLRVEVGAVAAPSSEDLDRVPINARGAEGRGGARAERVVW